MCYIMISKRINNNRDLSVESKIKKVALEKLEANSDGFFIQNNGDVPLRTMDKNAAIKAIKDMPFDNAIMHFRYATVGKKEIANVHGWEAGGFQFLHNGGVSEYEPTRDRYGYRTKDDKGLEWEHTDSKLLFDDLRLRIMKEGNSDKKIIKAIKYVINNCTFWGRAVLIDKARDKAFLFGDWKVYLTEKSYLVFSSHDISFEQDYRLKTHGCTFEYSVQPFLESTFDGIVLIKNFSKPDFHCKFRGELEDKTLDERVEETEDCFGQVQTQLRWTRLDKDIVPVIKQDDKDSQLAYDPDDGTELDIWDVPEYQSMNPYDMDVITNEEGTHDVYGICCEYGTCWIYESRGYLDYKKSLYREERQMELAFLNGLQKEEELPPREEVLLEV